MEWYKIVVWHDYPGPEDAIGPFWTSDEAARRMFGKMAPPLPAGIAGADTHSLWQWTGGAWAKVMAQEMSQAPAGGWVHP